MKKKVFSVLLLYTLLLTFFTQTNPVIAARGTANFETPRFDVNITVGENNVLHVEERITMNLLKNSRGLLRNIPYVSDVTRVVNGEVKTVKQHAKISNIRVENQPFTTYKENDNMYIRIGDKDKYLTGTQQYNISYDYALLGTDGDKQGDLLYFNILPAKWDSQIDNATLTVTMPKPFDKSKLEFISTRNHNTSLFNVSVNGNTITATLKEPLKEGDVATAVMLHLPEGYFSKIPPFTSEDMWGYGAVIASFLLAFLIIYFTHYRKQPVKVTEYYPPNNLTPAEIGFLYKEKTDARQLVAMILHWADNGYIIIEQVTKKNICLHKVCNLPKSAPGYEREFFKALFKKGRSNKEIGGLKGAHPAAQLKDIKGIGEDIDFSLDSLKSAAKRKVTMYKKGTSPLQILLYINMFIPTAAFLIYGQFADVLDNIVGHTVFPLLLPFWILTGVIVIGWDTILSHKIIKLPKILKLTLLLVFLYFYTSPLYFHYSIFSFILLLLTIAVSAYNVYAAIFYHPPYTRVYRQLRGKILGFKDFLENAEKDKIETLVDEFPHYFYYILPYAYVLGVTKKWIKKLESVTAQPPTWYVGGNYSDFRFDHITNSMNHIVSYAGGSLVSDFLSSSSDSGGSSSYDSGSSSGGGGFSDGGSGGGGGTTW